MANVNLQDYKGYSFNQKILDDCQKILLENKEKALGFLPRPSEQALVCVTTEKQKGEIKSIGGSVPFDIIVDNFGKWWAGMAGANNATVVFQITSGANVNFKSRGTVFNPYNFSLGEPCGGSIQVGNGVTPVTRQDFNIESPFVSAPESVALTTPNGGYNSGLGQVSYGVNIGATGSSGLVSETATIMRWTDLADLDRSVLIFHDNISPTVSFIAGNFINVNYIIQL